MPVAAIEAVAPGRRNRVDALLKGMTQFLSEDCFELRSLIRDAERLADVDGIAASAMRAEIYQLTGNVGKVRYWLANTRRLGASLVADRTEAITLSNLGYFSEAAAAYVRAISDIETFTVLFSLGTLVAAFRDTVHASGIAVRAGWEIDMRVDLMAARRAHEALFTLNVSEEAIRTMLDVAGEVLRRHSLIWADPKPLIRTISDEGDVAFLYQLYVHVPAEQAYGLTEEAAELMIKRDLYLPGVSFRFLSRMA